MEIKRYRYLKKLTDRMNNGLIKVITGIRRSGKSYLLFELFYTNPKKLSDTFKSVKQVSFHPDTINHYLEYLCDSYLISQAKRYDIQIQAVERTKN